MLMDRFLQPLPGEDENKSKNEKAIENDVKESTQEGLESAGENS